MWTETEWLEKTEGSAMRRIGYEQWQRNLAIALGNAQTSDAVITALNAGHHSDSQMVRDHVQWALDQHKDKKRLDV